MLPLRGTIQLTKNMTLTKWHLSFLYLIYCIIVYLSKYLGQISFSLSLFHFSPFSSLSLSWYKLFADNFKAIFFPVSRAVPIFPIEKL